MVTRQRARFVHYGLLNQLTRNVLETALDAKMSEHLGYDKHDPAGWGCY